jgi:heme-degrading monooxygenase HmoA
MIVRSWSARASSDGAHAYIAHFNEKVLPQLQRIGGHRGTMLLRSRAGADDVELVVLTFWDSLAAIRAFAGDDLEAAVVEDDARAVLRDFDTRVRHFELVAQTHLTA